MVNHFSLEGKKSTVELRLKFDFLLWGFRSLSKELEVKGIRKPESNTFQTEFTRDVCLVVDFLLDLEHFQNPPKVIR